MKTIMIVKFYLIIITLALFLSACHPALKSSGIVEVTCDQKVLLMNYADLGSSGAGADGRFPVYINGASLMAVGGEAENALLLYLYLPEDGKQLNVRTDGGMLYINDKLRAIDLSNSELGSFEAWFASADEEDYRQIQWIVFDGTFETEVMTILSANPNVLIDHRDGVWTEKPLIWFHEGEIPLEEIGQLDLSEARVLSMPDADPEAAEAISKIEMPNLSRLITWDDTDISRFLCSFSTLKSVSMGYYDLPNLAKVKHLEELHVFNGSTDEVLNLGNLPKPKALRVLTLPDIDSVTGLEKLTRLEYLNPGKAEFNSESLADLVSTHSKLRFLNLVDASTETLEPLRQAKSLEVVCLGSFAEGVEPDFSPLGDLKHLRYIGLPDVMIERPEVIAAIQDACPRCSIYNHDGFCLGSGWPTLFLPLFLCVLIHKRRSEETR